MNILVLGSGGREHALSWKLKQSPLCKNVYIAPGNAGTSTIGINVQLNVNDFDGIAAFALDHHIQMIVVGPEDPLVRGISDYFQNRADLMHIALIGPTKAGAKLEGSKDFSKQFMTRHGIPTARSKTFTKRTIEEGLNYVSSHPLPIVLKADGLAAGKGVIIAEDQETARQTLKEMLLDEKFGAASQQVVIEQFLSGIEVSVFVLTDGKHYKMLPSAKDYKRIGEGDTGLNTGGMGAVTPVPFADATFMEKVEKQIVEPTIEGLSNEKINYKGFLFIGLMNVEGNPFVIEYNVRMGDPETQVVMPAIESDLLPLLNACATGRLNEQDLVLAKGFHATVVMVSGGYPGSYEKGHVIEGLKNVEEGLVFHAGTDGDEQITTNGGRVLAITGQNTLLEKALSQAYESVAKIHWQGANFRKDIGQDLLKWMSQHQK